VSVYADFATGAVALASTLIFAARVSAEENCLYQLSDPAAEYVLGSLVTPQSNYLVVARCGKTIDEVKADLAAPARERAKAAADAQALRVERARAAAEALAATPAPPPVNVRARSRGRLQKWWDWTWKREPF
jgi:hypothetical protein